MPNTKELPHEDLIPNIVAEGEVANKLAKFDDVEGREGIEENRSQFQRFLHGCPLSIEDKEYGG